MLSVALGLAPVVLMLIRIVDPAFPIKLDGSNGPTSWLFPGSHPKLGIAPICVKAGWRGFSIS